MAPTKGSAGRRRPVIATKGVVMKFPGMILMGAQSRLLPPSVPFRFFLAAAVFHVVAWGLLALDPGGAVGFAGGPGVPLATLHAVTLGVIATTAMGATFQILPVATSQPLRAVWPAKLVFGLHVTGVCLLLYGFAFVRHLPMAIGGLLCSLGFLVFAVLVWDVLRRVRDLWILAVHGKAALVALVVLSGLGFALVADMEHGFMGDHRAFGAAHLVIALYGFMGILAFGYSSILVPMFALAPALPEKPAANALAIAMPAIAMAVAGLLVDKPALTAGGAVLGLVAAGIHIHAMLANIRHGMRKNLGLSFVLVRAGWGLLMIGILLGGLLALGLLGPWGATLFGFVAVWGWLLTFLLGMLQRIIPFLAAMNAGKAKGTGLKPPRLSELAPEPPLRFHTVCHFAALAAGAAGIVLGSGRTLLAAALAGLAGALVFLWFAVGVLMRMRGHWAPSEMYVGQQTNGKGS